LNQQIVTVNVLITRRHFLLYANKHTECFATVCCRYQLEWIDYVMWLQRGWPVYIRV